jgi:hypothetical protein
MKIGFTSLPVTGFSSPVLAKSPSRRAYILSPLARGTPRLLRQGVVRAPVDAQVLN